MQQFVKIIILAWLMFNVIKELSGPSNNSLMEALFPIIQHLMHSQKFMNITWH